MSRSLCLVSLFTVLVTLKTLDLSAVDSLHHGPQLSTVVVVVVDNSFVSSTHRPTQGNTFPSGGGLQTTQSLPFLFRAGVK